MLLVSGWFCVFKTIIPDAQEHFLTPSARRNTHLFGGLGLKRLDDDGEVIGFLIHEMSSLKEPSPLEFELASETPADDVANVTVREVADRLGVSECRVRKLARDGRLRGAIKAGAEWLIQTPVEVIPGRRGPVGVAGRVNATEG